MTFPAFWLREASSLVINVGDVQLSFTHTPSSLVPHLDFSPRVSLGKVFPSPALTSTWLSGFLLVSGFISRPLDTYPFVDWGGGNKGWASLLDSTPG